MLGAFDRLLQAAKIVQAQAAAAKTSTAQSAAIDTAGFGGAMLDINLGAVSGTTPSNVITVEESADGSTGWAAISGATLTLGTSAANKSYGMDVPLGGRYNRKRYLRVVQTISGTTPSFTIAIDVLLYAPDVKPVTQVNTATVVT